MSRCDEFLAEVLHETVPVERVYSVFAPEIIATLLVDSWTNLRGMEHHAPDPYYYTAKISFCSRHTLSRRHATQDTAISMRPARMEDIEQVADLCFEFALTSDPFTLTRDGVFDEAADLIKQNLIWTLEGKSARGAFVGHDNSAAKVYGRVGFVGLGQDAEPVDEVDPWLELV
ncbi:hypothetical protein K443DRAFT_8822 [Laccaria amethystina LaAM-08-1]|uniref:Uncharacterized protein n=1 Tax=Laccaria amethystina LaAM-08-1 TaxID=1095629 RepID=A0A0C9XN12_9AGAR|nr:hypothetical protein K443DRAFT_8822 [Laccaria amethystina LaAM-08-1]